MCNSLLYNKFERVVSRLGMVFIFVFWDVVCFLIIWVSNNVLKGWSRIGDIFFWKFEFLRVNYLEKDNIRRVKEI